jgi:hypothetical protein
VIHARQSLAGKGYEQKSLMKADPTFTVDDMANEFVHISYRPDTDEVRIGMYLFPVSSTIDKLEELELAIRDHLRNWSE